LNIVIFKTTVCTKEEASQIKSLLAVSFPAYQVNFDLSDCDRILRIVSVLNIQVNRVIGLIDSIGIQAEELGDEIPPIKDRFQSVNTNLVDNIPLVMSKN